MFLFYGYRAPRRRAYIYTRVQLATSVKGKREKEAIVSAAFGQQAGKLYEVLSATSSFHFTGRRLLLREFKRRERPIRSGGYRQFSCACFDFFYAFPYVYHHRPPSHHSSILRNYRPTLSPFLFYSRFFFTLLIHSSECFFFNFNKLNIEIYIL